MRTFLGLVLCLFVTTYISAQPVISSFSPASGTIGSSLTITGTGFSATSSNNIVFLGAVRANVTAASATSLTVTVPAGATWQPISVTVNALTGYSARPFAVTFPGGGNLVPSSFEDRIDSSTGPSPRSLVVTDIDGDQKPDLATVSYGNVPATFLSIHRNTGSNGVVSFATRTDLPLGDGGSGLAAADFDGDGKTDLAASYVDNNGNVTIFKNNSSPGTVSFAAPVTYPAANSPYTVLAKDIDLDGRPDLIISNYTNNSVSILRNTTTAGVISFAPKVEFVTSLGPYDVAAGDLDNDGKIDIAVTNQFSNNVSVFRNTSSSGSISFAAKIDFPAGSNPLGLTIGDADDDGKQEIIFVNSGDLNVSVLRNICTIGVISFAPRVNFAVSGFSGQPYSVTINDLDGDAKPDLMVAGPLSYIPVLKNTCTPGTISFTTGLNYFAHYPYRIVAGDFDLDNKPDIATTNSALSSFSVLRNRVNEPYINSFTPASAVAGGTITISGNNFTGVTAVSFGGVPATSFNIINSSTISAIVGTGASGDVAVVNQYGTSAKNGFTFNAPPQISAFTPGFSGMGATITITGSYFTGTTGVSFGGVPASSFTVNSFTSITAVVGSGATGNVSVTNPFGTGSLAGYTYYPPPVITSFTPTSGGIGTGITITGSNFTGATNVSVGGLAAASFIVNSSTSITALVAEGASGSISVTTPGGTTTSTNSFAFPPPSITSFTPESGPPGATVTITGTNFRSDTAGNFVFFGAVRAKVLTATTSSLTVTVPPGSTYQPLTVTVNNHTAYSVKLFRITFADGGIGISDSSFVWKNAFSTGGDQRTICLADLDGDGRSDIITGNSGALSVLRNTGSNGTVSFEPPIIIATGNGTSGLYIVAGDINSDGKPDIVVGSQHLSAEVYRNTSTTPGTISFASKLPIQTALDIRGVAISDFDGDARADLAFVTVNGFTSTSEISILRNNGANGIISFAPQTVISFAGIAFGIEASDFTGDGKPDLAAGITSNGTAVLKNTCTPGNISFDTPGFFPGSQSHGYRVLSVADIDGDGKPDLSSLNPGGFSVSRNTSSGGAISFSPKVDITAGSSTELSMIAGQLDGDGKTDILIVSNDKEVFACRNTSAPGIISFAAAVPFTTKVTYNWTDDAVIGDLEGDGKAEIAVANGPDSKISVFRNQVAELVDSVCANANISITADLSGTSYQWQANTGNGFVPITNNVNYSGATTATLQINNVPLAWNNAQYRCLVNGINSSIVNLVVNPVITPKGTVLSPAHKCINDIFSLQFNEISTNNVPLYSSLQVWHSINGGPFTLAFTPTYYGSPSFMNVQYTTEATIKHFIRILPPAGLPCAVVTNTDTITTVIGQLETPVITAAGYTITIANPDPSAAYTWQFLNTGTNTWADVTPAVTGTTYKVLVAGRYRVKGTEGSCLGYSNDLTVTTTAIAPVAANSVGIHASPNPAHTILTIDTLKLSDKWQSLDIMAIDGKKIITAFDIRNETTININVEWLRPGVYIAILSRKEGAPALIKFLKQ